ncbi:MAG: methionine--tRNA ligase [Patescibacteria group bacterium]
MKFYITTPVYYVNDRPHVGHAYTTVAADVLARWQKQKGRDVFFEVGTDEHGAKISQAAQKAGQTPPDFGDEKAQAFKDTWKILNIDYSGFIRTTDKAHETAVQKALEILYQKGLIYKGEYEGLYCVGCEQYKNPDDLVDGKCPDHQKEPEKMKEESYFFRLSAFAQILEEKISSGEFKIEPAARKNEALSFIRSGLKDVSISRKNVAWGIPLPFDKEYTTYVWVDAFLNYLTVLGWNPASEESENFKNFWPPDLQLMAKDILRVHATIWPGLLLGLGLRLPQKFFVHGFFTIAGQKMSKTLGNVIWPEDLVQKFGADASRYLLLSSTPFGQDGDISWEKMIQKYNADLANGLGNLLSRVFNLIENNFDGKIKAEKSDFGVSDFMENLQLFEALQIIKAKVDWANKYIDETKIWELVKNDKSKAEKILTELLGAIWSIGASLAPFMPETSQKIMESARAAKIRKGEILFPKIEI